MAIGGKTFVQTQIALLIASGLALLAIVAASLGLTESTRLRTEEVARAQDVRLHAYRLLSLLQDAETGQRGYLLTGQLSYLAPYEEAQRNIPAELKALAEGEPVGALPASIDRKMAELRQTVALTRAGRRGEAMDVVRGGGGKQAMDTIRRQIDGIAEDSNRRVLDRLQSLRRQAEILRGVSLGGGVLILMFASTAGWTVLRYTRELLQARAETERLNAELEERVQARTADLTRANEEIQRFAYIVSHDLRAPLVNIMGFTSEMEEGLSQLQEHFAQDDPKAAAASLAEARAIVQTDIPESIGFIRSSTAKMDRLINAILKLSREGARVLAPEPVDLNELISRSADSIRHQLDERGASVALEGRLPTVVSDRLALEQVFGNLIDNAVKYLSPDRAGRIRVRAREEGSRILVEVVDNGRGVAPQDHERIFELFRRSGAQDRPGEGIGLAHVRALVRRLGGEITVQSELGQGSTFQVRLPRVLLIPWEARSA